MAQIGKGQSQLLAHEEEGIGEPQLEPISSPGQEVNLTAQYGKGLSLSLVCEEESIGEPLSMGDRSKHEEGKSRAYQNNQEEAMEVRELEKSNGMEIRGAEAGKGGRGNRNPSTRRKLRTKGMWEVGEPSTHPRRLVRIRARSSQVRKSASSKAGTLSATISDGDIINCNSRLRDPDVTEEPVKLWELGKHIGIVCRRIEEEVVQEYQSMEVRDVEFAQKIEEGVIKGLLC